MIIDTTKSDVIMASGTDENGERVTDTTALPAQQQQQQLYQPMTRPRRPAQVPVRSDTDATEPFDSEKIEERMEKVRKHAAVRQLPSLGPQPMADPPKTFDEELDSICGKLETTQGQPRRGDADEDLHGELGLPPQPPRQAHRQIVAPRTSVGNMARAPMR